MSTIIVWNFDEAFHNILILESPILPSHEGSQNN